MSPNKECCGGGTPDHEHHLYCRDYCVTFSLEGRYGYSTLCLPPYGTKNEIVLGVSKRAAFGCPPVFAATLFAYSTGFASASAAFTVFSRSRTP